MLRSLLSFGVLGLSVFSFGCAEMTLGPRKMVDETVLSTHHKIIPSAGVRGSFTQTGTAIRVTAARTCDLVEVREMPIAGITSIAFSRARARPRSGVSP